MKMQKKTLMKIILLGCLIVAVFAVSLLFSGSDALTQNVQAAETEVRYHGDVDDDGEVTAADARLALRAAIGLTKLTGPQALAADMDGDGKVTTKDARAILKASIGGDPA